jgi:prophage antirepressor-like protein
VCRALGLSPYNGSYTHHLRQLHGDEHRNASTSDMGSPVRGSLKLISESGLYKLVMRSDKPEAREFQDWVTRVVLPAIRKDGAYVMGEEKVVTGEMNEDEFVLKALTILQGKAGSALLAALAETSQGLLEIKEVRTDASSSMSMIVGTEELTALLQDRRARVEMARPKLLPMIVPPKPWTN